MRDPGAPPWRDVPTKVGVRIISSAALEACYDNIFLVLLMGCILLQMHARYRRPVSEKGSKEEQAASSGLYKRYLPVWLCFKAADWLQGPYFHDVYSSKVVDGVRLQQVQQTA